MRTLLNDWLKFSVALMTVVALSSYATAQETTEAEKKKEESPRARLVKERRLNTIVKSQSAVEGFESVEMFDAIDHGEVEVIIRATSASKSNLIVKNTTDKPLAIVMPEAFSAVPVLRQGFGGQGGFGGGGGRGGGGLGGGGGVFNIPAGRLGKVSVNTVCLEEGKPDPKSRIEYKIQPLADLNDDPKIFEMVRMLANDEIAQPAVQAAAWNVTDGLSWQELLVKNRVELMDGSFERYFHPDHVRLAQQVVTVSGQRAEARAELEKQKESEETPESSYTSAETDN